MSILLNTNIKREYMIIPIIPIGGVHLHLHQKNLTYHSTSKKITGKFLIKREYKKRNMK